MNLALPIGISFYTFQSLSYIIDIYRGSLEPSKSLKEYAFFVSFFPALVAGPILRARQFLPQLREKIDLTQSNQNLKYKRNELTDEKKLPLRQDRSILPLT